MYRFWYSFLIQPFTIEISLFLSFIANIWLHILIYLGNLIFNFWNIRVFTSYMKKQRSISVANINIICSFKIDVVEMKLISVGNLTGNISQQLFEMSYCCILGVLWSILPNKIKLFFTWVKDAPNQFLIDEWGKIWCFFVFMLYLLKWEFEIQ